MKISGETMIFKNDRGYSTTISNKTIAIGIIAFSSNTAITKSARRKISMSSSLILRFDLLVVTVPFSPKSIIFLPEKNYALRNFVSPRPNLLSE